MIFLSLFLLTLASLTDCSRRKTPSVKTKAVSTVLANKKLTIKIASYLQNPYRNLAKVSKAHWNLFRGLTPGPLLADRLGIKELLVLKDFDSDANFFFYLDRSNFMSSVSSVFFESRRSQILDVSTKSRELLVLGAYRFMMRDEYPFLPSTLLIFLKALFNALFAHNQYRAAVDLFIKYKQFDFPSNIIDETSIHAFIRTLPILKVKYLMRFKDIHIPFVFSYIFKLKLSLKELQTALDMIEKAFLTNNTHFSYLISVQIADFVKNYLMNPVANQVFDDSVYDLNSIIIKWIGEKCRFKDHMMAVFLQDMNYIRFKVPVPNIKAIKSIILKWMSTNSAALYRETILTITLQTKSLLVFLTAIKSCLYIPVSSEFKFYLRKHPEIIKNLNYENLLKLHSNDEVAYLETLNAVSPAAAIEALRDSRINLEGAENILSFLKIEQLKELNLNSSQFSSIFVNLCSGFYNLNFELRFAFFKELLTILLNKRTENTTLIYFNSILIEEKFFFGIITKESIEILKEIEKLGVYWRIEAKTLKNLFKIENEQIFKNLKESEIFNFIAVDFYELVPLVTVDDWIKTLCPLFTLNPSTQFERVNGMLWPFNERILFEIDSVLDGKRPAVDFITKSNSWNILPRLALNSIQKNIDATSILRLWSRGCLMTFIMFVPDQQIFPILNKRAVIDKWLRKRPDDMEFNWRFASVFLDKSVELLFESSDLSRLEYNTKTILPFIDRFNYVINAKIEFKINWRALLLSISTVDEFKKVTRLASLLAIQKAFETNQELKEDFNCYYRLLYDFDFLCTVLDE